MTDTKPSAADLARLHAEWQEIHDRLRRQEQVLSEQIERYVRGAAARPDALIEEVQRMRADCAQRFQQLMEAVRADGSGP